MTCSQCTSAAPCWTCQWNAQAPLLTMIPKYSTGTSNTINWTILPPPRIEKFRLALELDLTEDEMDELPLYDQIETDIWTKEQLDQLLLDIPKYREHFNKQLDELQSFLKLKAFW
jgi:hypothetical protein